MAFPPNFDRAWDETFPPDTQLANLLGQDIRNTKIDLRERISLISGTFANRPTPDASWGGAAFGMLYFSTDTGQIFQWGGAAWTDITANFLVGSNGTSRAPNVVASTNLVINAAVGSTLLYNVPATGAGVYLFSLYGTCTATNGAGRSYPLTVTFTDDFGVENFAGPGTIILSANATGISTVTTFPIFSTAGNPINFAFGANGAGTGTVSTRIRLIYQG